MPQIAQLAETYASQIFWLLVFFGITFFVIGRGMVPKVMETVALRDKQISDDLAAAQAARDAADTQEEEWRERQNANRAEAHYLRCAQSSGGVLAPILPVWITALNRGDSLYQKDRHHASAAGAALAAATLWPTIRNVLS